MTSQTKSLPLSPAKARAIWLHAQRLDTLAPFGAGPKATRLAVEHLGYVQIDTISVIERCHHHILYSRIPAYQRTDLDQALSGDKSVFEYWTHALAYIPSPDYRFFVPTMDMLRATPHGFISGVDPKDYAALLKRIRKEGPLSIRDIDDEVLVEKSHPWDSRKPSKRALRLGFFTGDLTICKRSGMVKTYDLTTRHFGWRKQPKAPTEAQHAAYLLDRALRSQGLVSVDSVRYGTWGSKVQVGKAVEAVLKRRRLVPVHIEGHEKVQHWTTPEAMETETGAPGLTRAQILSPFDPLIIQRKRLHQFFDYEHRFEAYVPPAKRVLGYFALPILLGDEIVAAIDLKADRQARKLLMQKWTWLVKKRAGMKAAIEEALDHFELFQIV